MTLIKTTQKFHVLMTLMRINAKIQYLMQNIVKMVLFLRAKVVFLTRIRPKQVLENYFWAFIGNKRYMYSLVANFLPVELWNCKACFICTTYLHKSYISVIWLRLNINTMNLQQRKFMIYFTRFCYDYIVVCDIMKRISYEGFTQ